MRMSTRVAALDAIARRRLARQHVTSAPLPSPLDVVTHLLAVQAQDYPLARYAVGMRCRRDDDGVRAALSAGDIVRTHVLRPTWHFVARADLGWLLAATGPKVERSLASRHRQLGVDERAIAAALDVLRARLDAGATATRKELAPALAGADVGARNEVVGHLLLIAELRGVICGAGPTDAGEHRYRLLTEPLPEATPGEFARRMVERFYRGHGPCTIADLVRWSTLTQADVRPALRGLGFATVRLGSDTLYFDPDDEPAPTPRAPGTLLLSSFDECYLTYPRQAFPRSRHHPLGERSHSFAEAGGGLVVHRMRDIGSWKRVQRDGGIVLRLRIAEVPGARRGIELAADRLGRFFGLPAVVDGFGA